MQPFASWHKESKSLQRLLETVFRQRGCSHDHRRIAYLGKQLCDIGMRLFNNARRRIGGRCQNCHRGYPNLSVTLVVADVETLGQPAGQSLISKREREREAFWLWSAGCGRRC